MLDRPELDLSDGDVAPDDGDAEDAGDDPRQDEADEEADGDYEGGDDDS